MKPLYYIAKGISFIFSPIIVPFYCLILAFFITPIAYAPLNVRLYSLAILFALTFIIPVLGIALLYRFKKIEGLGLNRRSDRPLPYIMGMICYFIAFIFLSHISAPMWLLMFVLGGILAVAVNTAVNYRWKISGHMAAMGCATCLIFYLQAEDLSQLSLQWWTIGIVLLSGLVGSSRGLLDRHTLPQITLGYFNGLLSTAIMLCF